MAEQNAHYIIGPRDPQDSEQLAALRECMALIGRNGGSRVSERSGRLEADLSRSLAEQVKRQFAGRLIIEPDVELGDPRVMPDLSF